MTNRIKYQPFIFLSLLFANALRAGVPTTTSTLPVRVCVAAPLGRWTVGAALVEANRVLSPMHVNFDWQVSRSQSECEKDATGLPSVIQIRKADTIEAKHALISFESDKSGRIAVINEDELSRVGSLPFATGFDRALPYLVLGRAIARSVVGLLDDNQRDLPKTGMLRDEWTRYDLSVAGSGALALPAKVIEQLQSAAAEKARTLRILRAER